MPKTRAEDPYTEKVWCPKCARKRVVVDRFDDVKYVRAGQLGVRVTALECGHSLAYEDGTFYPLP